MGGHNGIVVHTMAGTFAGTDSYFHQNGWSGTESTVGVAGSGYCKQWVPWNRQADANLDGNWDRLSIECADYGETFPPSSTASDESPPLTDAQVAKIIDLCVFWCRPESHASCPSTWACRTRGIPARYIATSCEHGIGVHRHGIDPWRALSCPPWSLAGGKICPRSVRLRQVRDVIVPEIVRRLTGTPGGKDDKMYAFVKGPNDGAVWLTDLMSKRHMRDTTEYNGFLWVLASSGATLFRGGQVDVWEQSYIDNIPTVNGDTMFKLSETHRLLTGHTGDRIGDLWEREGEILGQTTEILGVVTEPPPP
jgi:hypothetical protein